MTYSISRKRQGKLSRQYLIFLSSLIYIFCYCNSGTANVNQRVDVRSEKINNEDTIQWPQEGSTRTGGWIETAWQLLDPYNHFCPLDTCKNEKTQVGCVALAMAQIVNYHKHLTNLHFDENDRYTTLQGIAIGEDNSELEIPGFDILNTYLDTIRDKYDRHIELDSTEIAALAFACGITIKMNYTCSGSYPKHGIWYDSVAHSYKVKMGYFGASAMWKDSLINDTDNLKALLIENMINGLPVIIILEDHAIIADGYRSDSSFHFNFGYGVSAPLPITEMWWTIEELVKRKGKISACIFNINPNQPNDSPKITTNYDQVYFLNSEINKTRQQTIRLSNPSEYNINIDHIIAPEYFDHGFEQTAFPIILEPGEEISVDLTFTPDITGPIDGKLQVFVSCNGVEKYLEIYLYGECIKGYAVPNGNVSGRWRKEESPYQIMGNIVLPEGKKLIIEPGTKIIFRDSYQLLIKENAQLVAKGTDKDSIYFTACDTTKGWRGLVFENSALDDTLEYCVLSYGNQTGSAVNRGGAITIIGSSPIISHSRFNHNNTSGHGGAIYIDNSAVSISDTRFENNKCSQSGGALCVINNSYPSINDVAILANSAMYGGAISVSRDCLLNMENVTIINNSAFLYGGGINCSNSEIILNNVSIHHNSVQFYGGGIYVTNNSFLTFDRDHRCNIYSNDAQSGKDLYNDNSNNIPAISVFVDTFTVLVPTDTYSYAAEKFTFNILHEAVGITTDIRISEKEIPLKFYLSQNFPNPFNASTRVKFDLPYSTHVKIEIYNIIGQKIVTLLNEYKSEGNHEVAFDAQNLSSGTYLYRIQAGEYQAVKKMVLVK